MSVGSNMREFARARRGSGGKLVLWHNTKNKLFKVAKVKQLEINGKQKSKRASLQYYVNQLKNN